MADLREGETQDDVSHTQRNLEQLNMPDEHEPEETDSTDIQVGDVCLDLAQGRPVHVIEDTHQSATEWSEANSYDLEGNNGNARLGTGPNDRVFDVVYCSSIKSEPSKSYAMPESRLVRVETESADDGRPVADRVAVDVLEGLFDAALRSGSDRTMDVLEALSQDALGKDVTNEARELAKASQFGGDEL